MTTGGSLCAPGLAVGPSTSPAAAAAITDTGTAGTGITICTAAQGLTGWLSCIYNQMTGAIPAGTNIIGKVSQDTSPWIIDSNNTGNLYTAITGPIPSGTNVIGAVTGGTAAGSSLTANPLTTGGRAQNAENTAVTTGQVVNAAYDLTGKVINLPYANSENFVQGTVTITASTSPASLIASGGTGNYIYITSLNCINSGSSSTIVQLQNGNGGTVFWTGYAASGGGSFNINFPTPLGGKSLSTATAVYVVGLTSTSSLYCTATGYKGV
jgi:hypothetical protein